MGFLLCSEENWVRPRVIQCLSTPSPCHPCRASKCHGSEKRCLTQGMWPATVAWYLAETVAPIQSMTISIPKLTQPKERKSFYNANGARIVQKAPTNSLLWLFYFYSSTMPAVGIHRDPFLVPLHYQESKKQTVSATWTGITDNCTNMTIILYPGSTSKVQPRLKPCQLGIVQTSPETILVQASLQTKQTKQAVCNRENKTTGELNVWPRVTPASQWQRQK